ncbi:transaldolase family protein, partial [Klebsiella pneumoniae]|uniref:transaldolase family protein n=1 Tax=Klebsiella pneumoniae TaxID=573 RepID=UPI003013EAD0
MNELKKTRKLDKKFFVDSANIEEIRELKNLSLVDGVTTNPSLILKSGRNILDVLKEICTLIEGPVSAEVAATEFEIIMKEAAILAKI